MEIIFYSQKFGWSLCRHKWAILNPLLVSMEVLNSSSSGVSQQNTYSEPRWVLQFLLSSALQPKYYFCTWASDFSCSMDKITSVIIFTADLQGSILHHPSIWIFFPSFKGSLQRESSVVTSTLSARKLRPRANACSHRSHWLNQK